MPKFWIVEVMALLIVAGAGVSHAERIEDPQLGFSLNVPVGFTADPELRAANPNFAYAFRRPPIPGDEFGTMLIIERLHRPIGREPVKMSHMPAGFAGRLLTVRWHAFDI